jgi:hypothetical protein
MRNRVILVGVGIFLALVSCVSAQQPAGGAEEKITISTYYPSPYGVYKTLRLFPNDDNTPDGPCTNAGELYFDESEQQVYVCSDGAWKVMGLTWFDNVGVGLKNGASAGAECTYTFTLNREHHDDQICMFKVTGSAKKENGSIFTRIELKKLGATPQIAICGPEIESLHSGCASDSGWIRATKAEITGSPKNCYSFATANAYGVTVMHPSAMEGPGDRPYRYSSVECKAIGYWQ